MSGSSSSTISMKKCGNCHRDVPSRALMMHESRCARINTICHQCEPHTIVLKQNLDWHNTLLHRPLACPWGCGATMAQRPMQTHLREHCTHRLVPCLYCPLHVRRQDRGPHQGECGTRPAACPECASPMQRKQVYHHLQTVHGMNRSSLTFRDLMIRTPSKTWGSTGSRQQEGQT